MTQGGWLGSVSQKCRNMGDSQRIRLFLKLIKHVRSIGFMTTQVSRSGDG